LLPDAVLERFMLKQLCAAALLGIGAVCGAQAVEPGAPAPDFSAQPVAGGAPLKLSSLRGKVVYLDFWASWCAPCRESVPVLDALRAEWGARGFEVVAVNLDADPADAQRFLRRYPVRYPVLGGVGDTLPGRYGVAGMPSAYIIDRKGIVRGVHQGFRESQLKELRAQIDALLREGEAK
jgi:thiol-disulfide isomerase/thioredoxin